MKDRKKIKACKNHLTELYDALKARNLRLVEEIEHKLTPSEECVACAYVFKTKGAIRDSLEDFLNSHGFEVSSRRKNNYFEFWAFRIFIWFTIFITVFLIKRAIWSLFFTKSFFIAGSIDIFEFILVFAVSIVIFLFVEPIL